MTAIQFPYEHAGQTERGDQLYDRIAGRARRQERLVLRHRRQARHRAGGGGSAVDIEEVLLGSVGAQGKAEDAAIGEERGTLEDVIEPYLIQQGFLARTARGRVATRGAWQHFGRKVPERAAANLRSTLWRVRQPGVDVVHATNYVGPPTKAGEVVSVYDLGFIRYPEFVAADSLDYPELLRRAVRRGACFHTTRDRKSVV